MSSVPPITLAIADHEEGMATLRVARGGNYGITPGRHKCHPLHFALADCEPLAFQTRANGIEIQTPCLIDKIVSEIIVRFFCNLLEAYAAVDLPRSR